MPHIQDRTLEVKIINASSKCHEYVHQHEDMFSQACLLAVHKCLPDFNQVVANLCVVAVCHQQ